MKQKSVQSLNHLEKILRYALGLEPFEFGLFLDDKGYASLKELVAALQEEEGLRGLTPRRIMELANAHENKGLLEVENNRIRLNPALASLSATLYPSDVPLPKFLYVGLRPTHWQAISQKSLIPKDNEAGVRLFSEKDMALRVAKRFCPEAALITVSAQKARLEGAKIWAYSEKLWLSEALDSQHLSGPAIKAQPEKEPKESGKTSPRDSLSSQGSPIQPALGFDPVSHRGKKKGKRQDAPDWKNQARLDRRKDRI
jgi:putative RNA 2'-phosphotransferase